MIPFLRCDDLALSCKKNYDGNGTKIKGLHSLGGIKTSQLLLLNLTYLYSIDQKTLISHTKYETNFKLKLVQN